MHMITKKSDFGVGGTYRLNHPRLFSRKRGFQNTNGCGGARANKHLKIALESENSQKKSDPTTLSPPQLRSMKSFSQSEDGVGTGIKRAFQRFFQIENRIRKKEMPAEPRAHHRLTPAGCTPRSRATGSLLAGSLSQKLI